MEGRAVLGVAFIGACALAVCAARAATTQQSGQYALAQGSARIISHIALDKNGDLSVQQFAKGSRSPLSACGSAKTHAPCYESSDGQPVHVVLVRDDFGAFSHVHPQAHGSAYTVHVGLEPRRRYYAFVSSKIRNMPEQAFRFVLQSSAAPAHIPTTVRPIRRISVGPYDVSLEQPTAKAAHGAILNADIERRPHTPGVSPFHAAWVQAVLVNTSTLTYAHIDGASDRGLCCEYALRVPPLSKGLYKLWLQFDDGTATYTAPLTFSAQ